MIGLATLARAVVQTPEARSDYLLRLKNEGVAEAMVLATCARTELYAVADEPDESAARHLFRLCSGLDSAVLGETEIVAQIKEAWALARQAGTMGPRLDLLLRHAMRASKRVRTETELCRGVVSYAGLAVREASAAAQGLGNKRVLVIGAGEMGERVVRELRRTPPKEVVIASRTLRRAAALGERFGHQAVPLGTVSAELEHADIVFGAVSEVVAVLGRFVPLRPLVAVDLGEPPCLPNSLTERDGVTAINLTTIVRRCLRNAERRSAAVTIADGIIEEELTRYRSAVAAREARRG